MTDLDEPLLEDEEYPTAPSWCGTWFTPTVNHRYLVPEDAANYASLRGKAGICIDYKQSEFGHAWAVIKFDGPGEIRTVRTCYLKPVKPKHGPRPPLAQTYSRFECIKDNGYPPNEHILDLVRRAILDS